MGKWKSSEYPKTRWQLNQVFSHQKTTLTLLRGPEAISALRSLD